LQVRILPAEDSVHSGRLGLETKGLDVVGGSHQVGLRRQFVSRVSPIGIVEGPELPAVHKGLESLLHIFKIGGAAPGGVGHIVRKRGRLNRIRLEGADDIHPVQGVEVVEMDDMILLILGSMQEVPKDAGIFGNLYTHGMFHCPHRGQSMGVGSDSTGTLHKMVGVPGISTEQNDLDPPEHGA